MTLIDTHQHLWDLSKHGHAWAAGIPLLNRSFLPSDYEAASGGAVDRAVFVECDADDADVEREAKWACALGGRTAAVVAGCRPETNGFEAYLDRIAHPRLRGVRRVLHTQPDDRSASSLFVKNVASLGARKLTFDLCVLARQLPAALQLVRACAGTSFVLDHCGVPDVKGAALDPWRDDLRAIARESNVVACKASGLVAYADASKELLPQIKPFFDHALECFGPARLMFGGDWPVCLLGCELSTWIEIATQLVGEWSPGDRAAFFSGNASKVYRL
jgi:predicted TIM-barrel fold metal-dependent hydrolase